MNKFVVVALSAFWLGACDTGVPPRNQADTLAQTSTSPSVTAAATIGAPQTPEPLAPATTSSASSADATGPEALSPSTAQAPKTPISVAPPPVLSSAAPQPQTPPPVLSSATPAASAKSPFDPERACTQDSDCELVPDDCRHCPPCEGTWRRAVNRAALKRIVKAQRSITCPPIMCPRCYPRPAPPGRPPVTTGYLGNAAKCEARQCVAK